MNAFFIKILFSYVINWIKFYLYDGFEPFTAREIKQIFKAFIEKDYDAYVEKYKKEKDSNVIGKIFLGFLKFLVFDLKPTNHSDSVDQQDENQETRAFLAVLGQDGKAIDINRKNSKFKRDFTDVLTIYDSIRKTIKIIEEKELVLK